MRKWAVFHAESSPLIDFTRGGGEIKVRLAEIIMMRPGMGNRQNCKLSQVPIKQKIKLNYASRLRPTTHCVRARCGGDGGGGGGSRSLREGDEILDGAQNGLTAV